VGAFLCRKKIEKAKNGRQNKLRKILIARIRRGFVQASYSGSITNLPRLVRDARRAQPIQTRKSDAIGKTNEQ
jgi:hypothetical protein